MARKSKKGGGAETDLEEMKSLAQRLQADFSNYRRRIEEEHSQLQPRAQAEVIERLLPVIDNFARAAEHVPSELIDHEWVKGIEGIEQQFMGVLSELGIERIPAVGEQFDPTVHEAIVEGRESRKEDGMITEEFESGWRAGDRIIRPAKVKVNKKEVE